MINVIHVMHTLFLSCIPFGGMASCKSYETLESVCSLLCCPSTEGNSKITAGPLKPIILAQGRVKIENICFSTLDLVNFLAFLKAIF